VSSAESVHEIAVRLVRPGADERFRVRRAAFVELLTRQPGVGSDREFASFLSLPAPDPRDVFVGMTTYDSLDAVQRVQQDPQIAAKFGEFAATMELKAYAFVQPIEGPSFDLATLASEPGQVLEVGVRRVVDREAFDRTRPPFIELLDEQPGVRGSWEFAVVAGNDIEGLTAGMTLYDDQASAQAAIDALMPHPVTTAYFASFEPVALQYVTSTTNR